MKAMVYTEYGPPDVVLELQEVEKPAPKENEVPVQVCAASVNYDDPLVLQRDFVWHHSSQ